MRPLLNPLPLALAILAVAGCSATYYNMMEKFGIAKREILADRVADTRAAQQEAKQEFADALQRFLAITRTDGGDLQRKYDQLNAQLRRSEAQAAEVRDRIAAVEDVAGALFREWKQELGQYTDRALRADSQRQLDATQRRYDALLALMRRAADRMNPVLATFRDQTLYLKHNLNAAAVSGLGHTQRTLEADIARLVSEMETSIREAENFIRDLKTNG